MKKQGISLIVLVSSWVVGIAILGILGYRVYNKIDSGATSDVWMDILLMGVAVLLVIRVVILYRKQK